MEAAKANAEYSTVRIVQHAVLGQALPLALIIFIILGPIGFLPTAPVCGLLFIGGTTAWSFHSLHRNRVALLICGFILLASVVLLWPRVHIRAATPADRTYENYFGVMEEEFVARNIAVSEGPFTLRRWLTGTLYHVQDGSVQKLNSFSVGRTPHAFPSPIWQDMRITLALISYNSENGPVTQIGTAGQRRGGGGGNNLSTSVQAKERRFVPGTLFMGQSRILYVEGDSKFTLTPGMTVQSFSEANKGSFYVVVVGLQ